jgi:protein SERAC1
MILQALIEMQHGDESDKANLKSVYGMLFFGVPSQGMSIESLVPMVENQPNRFFLESLSKVTDGLRAQRQNFRQVFPFKDSRIISFYETKQSPTAQKVSQYLLHRKDSPLNIPQRTKGGWEMSGPPAVLVDRHSATHGREWESDGQFIQPVNRNHSELVKFSNRDDEYQTVLRYLSTFRKNACSVIRDRFHVNGENSEYFLLPPRT